MFFFLECPWKSRKSFISWSLWIFLANSFIKHIYGCKDGSGLIYYRLRSFPEADVLLFPIITPSGFTIGTIINRAIFLNSTASLSSEQSHLMKPMITYELFDSLGCIRPVANITLLIGSFFMKFDWSWSEAMFVVVLSASYFGILASENTLLLWSVMCKMGMFVPNKDLPKNFFSTYLSGSCSISWSNWL